MVSHHDLMRCLERALRRAELPMATSQGFNPRPRVVFAQALGLGIEGRREVVELELSEPLEPAEVLRRLAAVSPPGLDFLEAEDPGPGRAPQPEAADYRLALPPDRAEEARRSVADLLAAPSRPFLRRRPDRDREIDLRPFVSNAEVDDQGTTLSFRLKIDPGGSARPEEVVETLGLRDLLGDGAVLVRSDLELAR
jgi:radical SAM-linked protein